jgi:hypothetical protein
VLGSGVDVDVVGSLEGDRLVVVVVEVVVAGLAVVEVWVEVAVAELGGVPTPWSRTIVVIAGVVAVMSTWALRSPALVGRKLTTRPQPALWLTVLPVQWSWSTNSPGSPLVKVMLATGDGVAALDRDGGRLVPLSDRCGGKCDQLWCGKAGGRRCRGGGA